MGANTQTSTVMQLVANETGVTIQQILSKKRTRPLPLARHLICFFLSVFEGRTNEDIAAILGGLNQSAVFYGVLRVRREMETKEDVRKIVETIMSGAYGEQKEG